MKAIATVREDQLMFQHTILLLRDLLLFHIIELGFTAMPPTALNFRLGYPALKLLGFPALRVKFRPN